VVKLRKMSLEAGESATVAKRHPLRADATTYSLYPGVHRVSVMVNGRVMGEAKFEVETV
jgi:spore coat protein U-like protein